MGVRIGLVWRVDAASAPAKKIRNKLTIGQLQSEYVASVWC
jgi:hypothetical protein